MSSELNEAELLSHVFCAAYDIGVELCPGLTSVQTHDGTTYVTATCRTFPDDDFARITLESALMVAILHGLDKDNVRVIVHCSPVLPLPKRRNTTDWIKRQIDGVNDWATLCTQQLAQAAYTRVVETYPWREAERMRSLLPVLVLRCVRNVRKAERDEAMQGDVDLILPPMRTYLSSEQATAVVDEVTRHLGRKADSLLETYEVVHHMVELKRAPPPVSYLYSRLFFY